MLLERKTHPVRVVHFMDECFVATQTFVYDIVTGCAGVENWCVGWKAANQEQMPFPRIATLEHSSARNLLGLWERIYQRFTGESATLRRTLKRLRPDVVHAHFGPNGWAVTNWCRTNDVALVTSFYGMDASALGHSAKWRRRYQDLFAQAYAIVVEGPAMKERLVGLGCSLERLRIIPITIHCENYPFAPRVRQAGEELRILFIGRFIPKKGLHILLAALGLVRDALGPWQLRLIGDGPEADAARELIRSNKLEGHIKMLGFLSRKAMIEEMTQAHLLAAPSVTAPDGDSEGGAPTVLLEAQAMGLPVVASDHADIPFAVAPVYRAGLACEGDVARYAASLVAAVRAEASWPEMAAAGRQHVLEQHGSANFRNLETLYHEAAGVGADR